jgi:hypothetical protein
MCFRQCVSALLACTKVVRIPAHLFLNLARLATLEGKRTVPHSGRVNYLGPGLLDQQNGFFTRHERMPLLFYLL